MVECYLPGITLDKTKEAAHRAQRICAEMTNAGTFIRYLRFTLVPGEEAVFWFFEAANPDVVAAASERAGIAFERVEQALQVTAEE